jgi:hypothetical protein
MDFNNPTNGQKLVTREEIAGVFAENNNLEAIFLHGDKLGDQDLCSLARTSPKLKVT